MRRFFTILIALIPCAVHADESGVDRVVVYKAKRLMELQSQGQLVRSYRISLGDNPSGHKVQEGDERTPEGSYLIDYRNNKSGYHRSLHISYPNQQDRDNARKLGVDPGGLIMIHGLPNGYGWAKTVFTTRDWTNGCIAVTDEEIEEIWHLVQDGTPITINP
jgi:murein L,D-transpeptidase YafK